MIEFRPLAKKFFNLELPCTEGMLKDAFRAAAKRFHPDHGGDAEMFKAMKVAYDHLVEAGGIIFIDHVDKRERTTSGELLTELGLGLGPLVNGRDCEDCQHKGYTAHTLHKTKRCPQCDGVAHVFPCRSCQGTGKFKNPRGVLVPCRDCQATGSRKIQSGRYSYHDPYAYLFRRIPPGARLCPKCSGHGVVDDGVEKTIYHKCGSCQGSGEIKIYNPVILKNGLATQKQRKAAQRKS